MVQIKFYISFYIYIFIVKMRKTKKTNWVFRKWIIFILIWFFTLSITKAATIPDGLTLIRANIWNAVQYIKQSIFTSSGINSWTKLMDINADSKYVWINTWLLNIWTPFNQKFLSLDENWYLIYSDIPFFSGTQSPNYYVNEISFDSWTNVLTLNISWVWPITWYLEGIQWAQGPQGATWATGVQWVQGIQWIQGNTWATGSQWATWPQWPAWFLHDWVWWDTPFRDWDKWITNNPYIFNIWYDAVWIGPNWSNTNKPRVCNKYTEGLDIDWALRIRTIPTTNNVEYILTLTDEKWEVEECGHHGYLIRRTNKNDLSNSIKYEINKELSPQFTSINNSINSINSTINNSMINLKCTNWQIIQMTTNGRECATPSEWIIDTNNYVDSISFENGIFTINITGSWPWAWIVTWYLNITDHYLVDAEFNSGTNELSLYVDWFVDNPLKTVIDTYRRKNQEKNYIYNYNEWQKVLIWNNTWVEPLTQLEIRNDSWLNLMLTNYTAEQNRFAWFWFGLPNLRAAVSFQNEDQQGRGKLVFTLNNDENRQNFNGFDNIMTIKHVWNTWAVWINTWPSLPSVALEINDTMRLEPRTSAPFECTDQTLWSMFIYKTGEKLDDPDVKQYIYPCFCWRLDDDNNINEWLAMWRGDTVSCFNKTFTTKK